MYIFNLKNRNKKTKKQKFKQKKIYNKKRTKKFFFVLIR